ncbi:MAG TPA: hypothetical protein VEI02_14365 [Planctomycetota bacterium]|nr:hypothetical protein [Planctomycetota bacterium]
MKPRIGPSAVAAATLALFLAAACARAKDDVPPDAATPSASDASAAPPSAAASGGAPSSVDAPPAAPTASPSTPAPADAPKLSLHDGMEALSDAGTEEALETWAKGGAVDFDAAAKLGALIRTTQARIDWSTAKKRDRNPADFDRIVVDVQDLCFELEKAAAARDAAQVGKVSDRLVQRCVDCHLAYK